MRDLVHTNFTSLQRKCDTVTGVTGFSVEVQICTLLRNPIAAPFHIGSLLLVPPLRRVPPIKITTRRYKND